VKWSRIDSRDACASDAWRAASLGIKDFEQLEKDNAKYAPNTSEVRRMRATDGRAPER